MLISQLTGQREHNYREMDCQNPEGSYPDGPLPKRLLLTPTHECVFAPPPHTLEDSSLSPFSKCFPRLLILIQMFLLLLILSLIVISGSNLVDAILLLPFRLTLDLISRHVRDERRKNKRDSWSPFSMPATLLVIGI